MMNPSRQEDTSLHAPQLTETGRSVAGPLCGFRGVNDHDASEGDTVWAGRTAAQCANGSGIGL